jgi:hypothetical protein
MTMWGKMFASSGDDEQAAMLNEAGYALKYVCVGLNSHHGHEMQICYIADKLDKHGAEMVKELAEFVKLREEEAKGNNPTGGK